MVNLLGEKNCSVQAFENQNLCGLRTEIPTADYLIFHLQLNAAHIRYSELVV